MQKIKIRLPASITRFSPALESLGLALSLYAQVELTPRHDQQLVIETSGQGAGFYTPDLQHPVISGMMHVFQALQRTQPGATVHVNNDIPLASGLGAEMAFMVGGMIGANNLMNAPLNRDALVELVARTTPQPDAAITSFLGGLTTHFCDDQLTYSNLPLKAMRVIVALPEIPDYTAPQLPATVASAAVKHNMARVPLVMQALQAGDVRTLAYALQDDLYAPLVADCIPGYHHIAEVARLAGALATLSSGGGPALIVLAEKSHNRIAEAIETAFKNLNMPARVLVLPLDTQGVVISLLQPSGA